MNECNCQGSPLFLSLSLYIQYIMYNLSDEIILTLSNRGSIVSMAYIPLVSPLAPSCHKLERRKEASEFSSKVTLETTKVGMSLPTVLPATKPPQGIKVLKNVGAKEPGLKTAFEKEDEPITGPTGFLKKYWYIILAVIFMSLSAGTPEEEAKNGQGAAVQGQAGAGTAASSAPAAAAPIAASTPSPGGGAKHRRGKRA